MRQHVLFYGNDMKTFQASLYTYNVVETHLK